MKETQLILNSLYVHFGIILKFQPNLFFIHIGTRQELQFP